MKNIVILISGRGSNMEAIVRACAAEKWPARVAAVLSNRPDASGLQFASRHGIATGVVDHKQFSGRESFDAAMRDAIDAYQPDLVVLAGFMRILTPGFVEHYAGRMLNIHPSLLPSFPGCIRTSRRWRRASSCMARQCIS
jgi:phosphoribosylglycinamide formyltransferase-1